MAMEEERCKEQFEQTKQWENMMAQNLVQRAQDLGRETAREMRHNRLAGLQEGEDLDTFILKFEDALEGMKEPVGEWVQHLASCLNGAPASILAKHQYGNQELGHSPWKICSTH